MMKTIMEKITQIILMTVMVIVSNGLTSCKDEDGPKSPNKDITKPLIQNVTEGMAFEKNLVRASLVGTETTIENAYKSRLVSSEWYFVNNFDWKWKGSSLMKTRMRCEDTGYKGKWDEEMESYRPFCRNLPRIKVRSSEWNDEVDGDLNDHIKIRYKTYYDFIQNGYKWPEGVTGPWKEKTVTQFNADGGEPIMDSNSFFIIPDEIAREKCYCDESRWGWAYIFSINMYFEGDNIWYGGSSGGSFIIRHEDFLVPFQNKK